MRTLILAVFGLFVAYAMMREPICAKTTLAAFVAPQDFARLAAEIKPGQCDWRWL